MAADDRFSGPAGSLLGALGIEPERLAARGLRLCDEATDLVVAETGDDGREHRLTPAAARNWQRMKSAADADGIALAIVSAFRSIERQAEIIRRKLDSGQAIEKILAVSAAPGFSEHHTGRAVDVTTPDFTPLEEVFETSAAFEWLCRRAGDFGFSLSYPRNNSYGYAYEPWHWCYGAGAGD